MPLSINELLEAGAHFGHQTHRWNPKMKPYIYGARHGIYIINLEHTAKNWKKAYSAIVQTVSRGKKVLFVGTKPQAQEVIAEEAVRSGQFYVNRRWLGGMLTNFKTIKGRIDRLRELESIKNTSENQRLPKKELVKLDKERQKLEKSLCGIKDMTTLPGIVITVDPNKEHIAIREAQKLRIPVIAVADTNCNPEGIDYIIPANDDALKSIRIFLHDAAEGCMEGVKAFEVRIQEETRKRKDEEKQTSTTHKANGESKTTLSSDRPTSSDRVLNAQEQHFGESS